MTDAVSDSSSQALHGSYLLLGGARSGKSDLALRMAATSELPVTFVATAEAHDDDMAARITRHRAERPEHWTSAELPQFGADDVARLDDEHGSGSLIVVDCLTMLVSNLYLRHAPGPDASGEPDARVAIDREISEHVSDLAEALTRRGAPTIVVSNEVGMGVVPPTEMGRAYRDLLGRANRAMAQRVDHPLFVVAGCTLELNNWNQHL